MEWLDAGIVPFQDVDKLDALSVYQLADRDLAAEVTDKDVLVFFVVVDRGAVNIRDRLKWVCKGLKQKVHVRQI